MARGAGAASRNLEVEVITDAAAANGLSDEWNDLAVACRAQPFALPAMALPWWEYLGKGELRIVTARYGDGSLAGIAPLFERRRAGLRTVRFLGHGLGAIGGLLSLPSRANVDEALLSALRFDGAPTLALTDFQAGAAGFDALRRSDEWVFRAELSDECPFADLVAFPGTKELLADPSKSGVRKKLAKAWRGTADRDVSLSVAQDHEEVLRALDRVKPLYDRAEELNPRLHLDDGSYRPFFRAAMKELALRDQTALLTLEVDGKPAAFDVYVLVGPVAYAILGRYEPTLAEVSPGLLLMDHGVQWATDHGIERIDWQLGADPYKLRWSTGTYDTFNVLAGDPAGMRTARPILSAIEIGYEMKERLASWRN